jgi:hypothetical protein
MLLTSAVTELSGQLNFSFDLSLVFIGKKSQNVVQKTVGYPHVAVEQ